MPSTLVHVAFAGLIGTALLGRRFDAKGIAAVLLVAALIDLDTFVDVWATGLPRALFHNLVWPAVALALLAWDVRWRDRSAVRSRWGDRGVRVFWVAVVAATLGHTLHDAFVNGVNLLWPIHDRFYELEGRAFLSNQRGFVQTFVDLEEGGTVGGTTENTHYYTGVNPSPGEEPADVERIFPLAYSGERLLIVIVGYLVVAARIWETSGAHAERSD